MPGDERVKKTTPEPCAAPPLCKQIPTRDIHYIPKKRRAPLKPNPIQNTHPLPLPAFSRATSASNTTCISANVSTYPQTTRGYRKETHIFNLPSTRLIQRIPHPKQRITKRLRRADRGAEHNRRRVSRQRPRNTDATALLHNLCRNGDDRVPGGEQVALEMARRAAQARAHADGLVRVVGHGAGFFVRTRWVGAGPVEVLGAGGAVGGSGLVWVEEGLCALEERLRADCDFGAEAGDFAGCVLGEGVDAFLQGAHDAAVFLVLAHGHHDQVAHPGAHVDEGADGGESGEDAGELVALDVGHPDVVEGFVEFVEGGDAVDDGVAQRDV